MGMRDFWEDYTEGDSEPLVHETLKHYYSLGYGYQETNNSPRILKIIRAGLYAVRAWNEDWKLEGYSQVPSLDGGHSNPDELRQDFDRWAQQGAESEARKQL
jgi:hypothetical protein